MEYMLEAYGVATIKAGRWLQSLILLQTWCRRQSYRFSQLSYIQLGS